MGTMGYGGPAPPKGDRPPTDYYFVGMRSDVSSGWELDEKTTPAAVSFTMLGHTLGRPSWCRRTSVG